MIKAFFQLKKYLEDKKKLTYHYLPQKLMINKTSIMLLHFTKNKLELLKALRVEYYTKRAAN